MFIGSNIRTRIDVIKPDLTLGVNSNPHKNNLTLRTLSPNDHVIVRRYGSIQKWKHGKIVERISCKMYKVLINGKVEEKHIDEIKKIQTTENRDTRDDICDNTILLTKPNLNNSPGKRYPTRNRKPVSRYGCED